MNALSVSRIHIESTFSAKSLWTHYLLRDITMNTLSISWFHYEYTICLANWLWLSVTRIYEKFTMNTLWIHEKFTMNTLLISRILFEFTILFPKPIWIHYLLRDFSLNSFYFFEFTICFANSPWIHDPFQTTMILIWNHSEITMNSLSSTRFH